MAKKINENLEENGVTENEVVTSTGETNEELNGEKVENTVEDVKAEENVAIENIVVANTSFNDKYTGTKYDKGTEFVIVNEEVETEKISDKKYKISAKRAEEIKAKGYID